MSADFTDVTEIRDQAQPEVPKSDVAIFDATRQALAALAEEIKNAAFDVRTPQGYEACANLVKRIQKLRTGADRLREDEIAPLLRKQRALNAMFKDVVMPGVNALSAPFQAALDAEDKRVEDLRLAAEQREAERIRGHRDRIVGVRNLVANTIGLKAADFQARIDSLPSPNAALNMDEFEVEMREAVADVRPMLHAALLAAVAAEETRVNAERMEAENRALREQLAARPVPATVGTPPPTSEPVAMQTHAARGRPAPRPQRPTIDAMIDVLTLHYRVHESKVVEWLLESDIKAAGDRIASSF